MKVSKEKMAEHREEIIAIAAKRFRERGFDGISVSEVMKEAGLTHGGFYGHFSSKEELAALASERAIHDVTTKWEQWIRDAKGEPLAEFTARYLSLRHLDHPELGCLMAACGGELARQPASVKKAVTASMQRLFDVIGSVVPGKTKAARNRNAISVFATLIGGMILARSVSDTNMRDNLLQTVAAAVPHSIQ